MKIYLASRYSRIEELKGHAEELVILGHEVTSRWLKGGHRVDDEALAVEHADKGQ